MILCSIPRPASSSAARSILVFTLPEGVLIFALSDCSSSITGNGCPVAFLSTFFVSGIVEYNCNKWYNVLQQRGVSSLISSTIVFSITAGEDVSPISTCTESLKFNDCGGVTISEWAPGDFVSDFWPFLSLENLTFVFFSELGKLSRSGLIVSKGNLNEDIDGLLLFDFRVSDCLASEAKFV